MRGLNRVAPLAATLDAIIGHLMRLGQRAPMLLRPGLAPEEIRRAAAKLPFALPPEVIELFQARNGTRTEKRVLRDTWLFPGYHLLSLEAALADYSGMKRVRGWKRAWFPIFADGGGAYYVVDCEGRAPRGVRGFLPGESESEVEYASLGAMLATIEASFAAGAYRLAGKALEVDDDAHAEIAARLNPKVTFWREDEVREGRDARAAALASEAYRLLTTKKGVAALQVYEEAMALAEHGPSFYVNVLAAAIAADANKKLTPARMALVLGRKHVHADAYWNAACLAVSHADHDAAIAHLRLAKKKGADMRKVLADRALEPLAGDPRFRALGPVAYPRASRSRPLRQT